MTQISLKIRSGGQDSRALVVVVPKSAFKKAVVRNRLRRRIRSIMAPFVGRLDKAYIVTVGAGAQNVPFPDLKAKLESLVREVSARSDR